MRCPNCNAEIDSGARFCTECGVNIQAARQKKNEKTAAAAGAVFAMGQAGREARMSAYYDPDAVISDRSYNLILIGTLVWGLLVNVVICSHVGDVTRYISPIAFIVLYFISATAGIMISRKSNNAAVSFVGYNLVVIPLGLTISMLVAEYGGIDAAVVKNAFLYTMLVTMGMLGLVLIFPAFFSKIGNALLGLLIGLILGEVVLMFMGVRQTVTDWIAAGIFSLYIAYDIFRSQQFPKTVDNAVDCALDIYLDIANLFIRILQISGKKRD